MIIYRGNNHIPGETMRFYQHANYEGGFVDLGPGYYPNIHGWPYSFGDKISSAQVPSPLENQPSIDVKLVIRVYQHANYRGQYRDIVDNVSNMKALSFNDKISSIRIFQGEDYQSGWVANFFKKDRFDGPKLQNGNFGPGTSIPNINASPYKFNDKISSIKIERL